MSEKVSSAASSLFDLRTVIAILFAFYGVVLTIMGIVTATPENTAKSGGLNLNLWTGIGMLVLAAIFVVWARMKPLGRRRAAPGGRRPPAHAPLGQEHTTGRGARPRPVRAVRSAVVGWVARVEHLERPVVEAAQHASDGDDHGVPPVLCDHTWYIDRRL